MRGKTKYKKPALTLDTTYRSLLVAQLVNKVMLRGQKNTARNAVYRALTGAEAVLKKPALEILDQAIKNVSPKVEVRSKRIGGATYQVPVEVRPERRIALAIRWLINAARATKGKPIAHNLQNELINSYNNTGPAIAKKDDVHRMAEANKAFAHFARF